ncbi:hypothetical protein [Streptomyces sp. WAC06614]|uniref:hypothetical protein n=1 Tax=Streptomyces sp. WAC06614 TaxID=2487416 RepID=UPI000F79D803|nr:hypothetical protein [Streptomyces sp. WAC06614]RSS57969.1 hypothetical protein EF918_33720 [Streptomyces sp. WAC06614]
MIATRIAQAAAVLALCAGSLLVGATAAQAGDMGWQAPPAGAVAADPGRQFAPGAATVNGDMGWQ